MCNRKDISLLCLVQLTFISRICLAQYKHSPVYGIETLLHSKGALVNLMCFQNSSNIYNERLNRYFSEPFETFTNDSSDDVKTTVIGGSGFALASGNITQTYDFPVNDSRLREIHAKGDHKFSKELQGSVLLEESKSPESDLSAVQPPPSNDAVHLAAKMPIEKYLASEAIHNASAQILVEGEILSGSENTHMDITCDSVKFGANTYNPLIKHLTLTTNGTIEVTLDWADSFTDLVSLKMVAVRGLIIPNSCSWIPSTTISVDLSHSPLRELHLTDCNAPIKKLLVSGTGLHNLSICLPYVETVTASWNSLHGTGLHPYCQGGGASVKELKLTHNQLTFWSLCEWPSLIHLDLETNKITHIDLVTCHSKHLLSLNLAYNLLQEPPSKYPHTLEALNLSRNRLKNLTPFNSGIQELDVSHNLLTELGKETFRSAWQLLFLDLSHNRLTVIYGHDFKGLRELRSLDLSHNKLHHIRHEAFHSLKKIQKLKISNNALHTLDTRLLSYLPRKLHFEAYGNPWQCSCHLLATLSRLANEHCRPHCLSTTTLHCREGHIDVPAQDVLRQCIEAVQEVSEPAASIHLPPAATSDEDTSEEIVETSYNYKVMAIPGVIIITILIAAVVARLVYKKKREIKKYCNCLAPTNNDACLSEGTHHKTVNNLEKESDSETEL